MDFNGDSMVFYGILWILMGFTIAMLDQRHLLQRSLPQRHGCFGLTMNPLVTCFAQTLHYALPQTTSMLAAIDCLLTSTDGDLVADQIWDYCGFGHRLKQI